MNLQEFRKSLGLNQQEFANKLGVQQALIAMIENESRNPSASFCQKLDEVFNFKLHPEPKLNKATIQKNIIEIPLYQVAASAGGGNTLGEAPAEEKMYFDKRFLQYILRTENYKNLHLIYAKGDSMDSGWNQPDDIKDGDLLLVDTSQTTGNNQIFVILVNNTELRVKKLFKRGEALYISSNNPKYKEEVYYPDRTDLEIKVIGKVIWNGCKECV